MSLLDLSSWQERAPLPLPRAGCAAGVVEGKLLVAGGTYWREKQKFWSERVDEYDPATDRWLPLAPLPQVRGDTAAIAHEDTLYLFGGGADGLPEKSAMGFARGRWQELPEMTLPAARRTAAIAALKGVFYLLGGLAGTWTDYGSLTSSVWAAYPGKAWRPRAPMPAPLRFNAAVAALADRIIVAGGCTVENGTVRNLDEILAYDPASDEWSLLGRLPTALRGACGVADGERMLVIGGYTDKFETRILEVAPQSGQVSVVGQLPSGLADTRFFRIGPGLFGVTGENGIKMRAPETLCAHAASK